MVNGVSPNSAVGAFQAVIVGTRVERVGAASEKIVLQLNWSGREGFDVEHTISMRWLTFGREVRHSYSALESAPVSKS